MCRSKLKYVTDGQNQPTVDLGANNVNGVANGVNGAANGKQQYAFKDSGNDNFNVNPTSSDGTQGGIDSNPVCDGALCLRSLHPSKKSDYVAWTPECRPWIPCHIIAKLQGN